ncbi:unnamed protein product [Pleuronectes platessa]|uniref:Uncharacterized protein n=1 Tax=Pleuronectes platessa TaxID=8262 RepID=A0A9N7TXQ2_PLEPL|nr:unnamed protein product [Pleuronectes platessa]
MEEEEEGRCKGEGGRASPSEGPVFNISGDERNRMAEASSPGTVESGGKSMRCLFIGLTPEPLQLYICQTPHPPPSCSSFPLFLSSCLFYWTFAVMAGVRG